MARGWESKSVEEQMEAAAEAPPAPGAAEKVDAEKARRIANLKLSRSKVAASLAGCENLRYREMLERALADLDALLADEKT